MGHTCHGDWLNSGVLTEDEHMSLREAESDYSKIGSSVHRAEEAVFMEVPGAQEALTAAQYCQSEAYGSNSRLLKSLQKKYPHCFTCKVGLSSKKTSMLTMQNDAIMASEHEERFPPLPKPSQESRRIQ
jgi:hypothetical protein